MTEYRPLSGEEQVLWPALEAIGRALSLSVIYGAEHFRTEEAVATAWRVLAPLLGQGRTVAVGLVNGALILNGKRIPTQSAPLVRNLEKRLQSLRATGFSLQRGMNESEFRTLMRLLMTSSAETFAEALRTSGLSHIRTEQFVLKTEASDSVAPQGPPAPPLASRPTIPPSPPLQESRPVKPAAKDEGRKEEDLRETSSVVVQQIIAFLKGEATFDSAAAKDALAEYARDPARLAALILKAAAVHDRPADTANGETLADVVIGCLRRAYQGIREVQKPRKKTPGPPPKKALLLLEREILRRLHEWTRRSDPTADEQISKAIEDLAAESEIDRLAAELLKHRQAAEKTKAELQRAAQHGGPGVQEALTRAGLSESEWRQIVVSGAGQPTESIGERVQSQGTGADGLTGAPAGLGALALALERFEALLRSDPKAIGPMVETIRAGVESATSAAVSEIEKLAQDLETARAAAQPTALEKTEAMREALAEIGQDLLQPLTVINGALGMALQGLAGPLTAEMENLLRMAEHGSQRLHKIILRLIEITGYPTRLNAPNPDDTV